MLVALLVVGGVAGGSESDPDDKEAAAAAAPAAPDTTDDAADDAAAQAESDAKIAAADLAKKTEAEAKKAADAAKAKKAEAKAAAAAKAKAKKEKANTVKVTVAQILGDYEANELAADTKYEGKMIQVTGTIDKIDKEIFGNDYVLNISDGSEYSFLTVNCNDMSKKALSKLTVGNEVTAIGKFDDGGDLGVELKKCKVA
ncbi:hypothetical protein ASD10_08805 [Aeromicrobium sp. Root472D3]|nr:hypothetical protein ASD10_08805 [Aeromicrobium sp. Root472D3]